MIYTQLVCESLHDIHNQLVCGESLHDIYTISLYVVSHYMIYTQSACMW